MIICYLLGHQYQEYLQCSESNNLPIEDGLQITKIIYTFFICCRCKERHKRTESFGKKISESE